MMVNKLKLNTFSSLVFEIVTIVCGFILPRLIMQAYGSGINGYVVEYCEKGQEKWEQVRFNEGTSFTVSDLNAKEYDVRVRAFVDTKDVSKDVYNADIYYGDYSATETVALQ